MCFVPCFRWFDVAVVVNVVVAVDTQTKLEWIIREIEENEKKKPPNLSQIRNNEKFRV